MAFIGNSSVNQQNTAQIAYFSGNGSTTAFTLPSSVATVAQILVHVANVAQNPNTAFTVSGVTLTFTSAPPTGLNNIWVMYTSPLAQTIAPTAGTVNTAQLGNITNINSVGSNLTLQTNGATAVAIDQTGKVGLGTVSPGSLLTVNNTAFANASAIYVATNTQVTASSAYGGVITIRDSYASGSNTSFAGINFQASPGNDYSIGKLAINGNAYLSIYQSDTPTELVRFDATGNMNFRVANSGITFNNSSGLTNSLLNDYETGTFTPTVTASGGGAATYTLQAGYYVKVGAMVTCSWQISFAVNTLSGSIYFSGLPFTSVNSSQVFSAGSVGYYSITTAITGIYLHLGPNTTSIQNVRINTAASANANTYLANTNLSSGNTFVVSITYPANF